jgi:hypothetical protein
MDVLFANDGTRFAQIHILIATTVRPHAAPIHHFSPGIFISGKIQKQTIEILSGRGKIVGMFRHRKFQDSKIPRFQNPNAAFWFWMLLG